MAGQANFAVAPKLRGLVFFWAIVQIALFFTLFDERYSWPFRLAFVGIASAMIFMAFAFILIWYYRVLCRIRESGVVIDGEVESRSRRSYTVIYTYGGVEHKLDGSVDYFDMSIWRTFPPPEFSDKSRVPIKLLIDPTKPTRFFILPFETAQGPVSEPKDVPK